MSEATQRNWQDLAEAIIVQVASDYRQARYRNRKRPYQMDTLREIRELEQFFRSTWFGTLCNLDGAQLLRDLNKRMGEETLPMAKFGAKRLDLSNCEFDKSTLEAVR